ncbi:4F2 cell-surface antigen heavy chain [Salmo trutta]|uniref:4F2 cell-surface antigen heavy chain-like n=1 Tax=Salmo trutta TaxID=8032 RepID=A0A673VKR2_SALTR|nr:4F2 cell-surface antigen heavy chain-like [Salmo trutta]
MSKDTEIDMKDVELNELDQGELRMTGDGPATDGLRAEKNRSSVKLEVLDEVVKFTGLSKEELMKVSGTPGWVRTRWVLLMLFWLCCVGMLARAIVIIVQAPRCKPIPEMIWWNQGPLYQISDLGAFNHNKGIKGVVEVLDRLNQLKVKGLVLGPLHTVQQDRVDTLNLVSMDPGVGTDQDLLVLLDMAHQKGISVVLNLTPNPGVDPWFSPDLLPEVLDNLGFAAKHWLGMGVDGVQVSGLAAASSSPDWSKVQGVVQGNGTEHDVKKRALIGVEDGLDSSDVSHLLSSSGVDLMLSDILNTPADSGIQRAKSIQDLISTQKQSSLAWGLGGTRGNHLASMVERPELVRLYQLLLFTLPGTPVFNYGDEIGIVDQGSTSPQMLWYTEAENQTAQAQKTCSWFKTLSALRGEERSLLHGDYFPLHSSSSSLAFLRLWDQDERYVTAVNWGSTPATLYMALDHPDLGLPQQAEVKLSTDSETLDADSSVSLDKLLLGPGQAVLLTFPFV